MNRAAAIEQFRSVSAVLEADLREAHARLLADGSEFNKRTLVRSYFVLIEGMAHQLRQVALSTHLGTGLLTDGDLSILREERYQLSTQGVTETRDNFQRTIPKLLFTLRILAKSHGAEFVPKTSDEGWNCLRKAVQIRDRLTHPKSAGDLVVTNEEGSVFASGVKWWNDSVREALAACEGAKGPLGAQRAQ